MTAEELESVLAEQEADANVVVVVNGIEYEITDCDGDSITIRLQVKPLVN